MAFRRWSDLFKLERRSEGTNLRVRGFRVIRFAVILKTTGLNILGGRQSHKSQKKIHWRRRNRQRFFYNVQVFPYFSLFYLFALFFLLKKLLLSKNRAIDSNSY